ncbi:hypothetical protein FB451DRAFT_1548375 [Mycena latifolia]|nr:hypothetical protein FB451DRAFT_1548375 [Mycena latifolia]
MSNASLRAQASEHILAISHHELLLSEIQRQLDSIVYPVLTLPHEITSEIFKHCLPATRALHSLDPSEAPLLLLHVCSAWREIALATPALWATLDLNAVYVRRHFSAIFDTWLARARQRPLSVKIVGPLFEIANFDSFSASFRRHACGIQSLKLDITVDSVEDLEKMDTDLLGLIFPLLQSLSIRLLANGREDLSVPSSINLFHDAPLLQEVLSFDGPPYFIALPWQQLTKFTGQTYTIADCLDALRLMPNLVEVRFALLQEEASNGDHTSVSHLKIESFTLFEWLCEESGTYANSTEVLAFLTIPGLQTLGILNPDSDVFDDAVLDSFLSRSAPPLRRLVIRGDIEIRFTSLLAVPGLTDLEIWRPSSVFVALFFQFFGDEESIIPKLQTLSFLGCDGDASVSDIVEMAAAPIADRRKAGDKFAPLQSFRVVQEHYIFAPALKISEEALLPFKKLKADGMDIYIGTEKASCI